MAAGDYQELPISDGLKQRGVSKMIKQGDFVNGYTICIYFNQYNTDKVIRFDVHNTKNGKWKKTLANYEEASMGYGLSDEFKGAIAACLMENSEKILGYDHRESIKYEESGTPDDNIKTVTVNEAAHTDSGTYRLGAMITTRSKLYKLVNKERWVCINCNELIERGDNRNILNPPKKPSECPQCGCKDFDERHELINTVSLGLQEEEITEQDNVLDDLDARVFNDDTIGIQVGKIARVIGEIKPRQDPRTKLYSSVLLVKSIQYEHRKKLELTPADIKGIKKFRSICNDLGCKINNYEQRLISMFAPNVIGHEYEKLALLLSAIGAPETPNKEGKINRGRIHCLLIGPPGLGKTLLGKEVKQLRINSTYASGKRTTGKSLTAMVVRENEHEVLRLGPAAHARNAILFINEFDKLPPEDQDNLLEVMDEGMIDMTTFAKEFHIPAATTIIASANPVNNQWVETDRIDLKEIPFSSIMLNRFDIILPFRDTSTKEEALNYADTKTEYDQRRIKHNYNFLRKAIELFRSVDPVIDEHARSLLNNFYVEVDQQNNFASSPRTLDAIHRIAMSIARMYLSPVIDEKIAIRTIDFMNTMLVNFYSTVFIVPDPFMKSYEESIKVIQHSKAPIDLIESVKMATERSEEVKAYIGKSFEQRNNKKLRNLCTKILENPNIIRVSEKPTVVSWREQQHQQKEEEDRDKDNNDNDKTKTVLPCDPCDPCDPEDYTPGPKIKNPITSDTKESGSSNTNPESKVEKITRNEAKNEPEKIFSEVGEEKYRSHRSHRSHSTNIPIEESSDSEQSDGRVINEFYEAVGLPTPRPSIMMKQPPKTKSERNLNLEKNGGMYECDCGKRFILLRDYERHVIEGVHMEWK
jgi:DNA replicative helicase MCM subunit Mcm2 (Cdc46/Mcm family)